MRRPFGPFARALLLLSCLLAPAAGFAQGDDEIPGFTRPGASAEEPETEDERPDAARRPLVGVPRYEFIAVPDRWRIVEAIGVNERWYDPYNQSTLKADRPILGTQDWFLNIAAISDTVVEPRTIPVGSGDSAVKRSDDLDIFGEGAQLGVVQNFIASVALVKGDTVFRPPDYEFRVTAVANLNYIKTDEFGIVNLDPTDGDERFDTHIGLIDAFIDKHLYDKSDRYDFDSIRIGIQPMNSDFRGFLFQDNNLGARLFGTFQNNRIQYNLAYFRRIEKDTNSGVARVLDLREDDVFMANVYYQDFPVLGFTLQGIAAYNRNREDDLHRNTNDFQERPAPAGAALRHEYDAIYVGLNGDGHIDRLNLTTSLYYATGEVRPDSIAQRDVRIDAWFAAVEASFDKDWYRLKAFGLFQSGDAKIEDSRATGFDAIFENPNFAGADTSYWVRQGLPLVFGGGVALNGRNGILASLRSSKEEGQSNFVNPGLGLVGVGADLDLLPELRVSANASWLRFHHTEVLEELRQQNNVDSEIGWDLSVGFIYRPLFIQNVVFRASAAFLIPGQGFRDLYPGDDTYYSVLLNAVLTY